MTKVGVVAGFREVCDKGGCGGRVQGGVTKVGVAATAGHVRGGRWPGKTYYGAETSFPNVTVVFSEYS